MKFPKIIKSFTLFDIMLVVLFVFYLLLPIQIPSGLANIATSSIGFVTLFIVTVGLFVYMHPIVGILYIFVAYEFIQRSISAIRQNQNLNSVPHAPSVIKQKYANNKAKTMKSTISAAVKPAIYDNVSAEEQSSFSGNSYTLETELVDKLAPVGQSDATTPIESSYGPVYQSTGGASVF